ncbi:acyl-CoA synthetase (AMP-forming)/AMP-acid ligase II [Rhodococcus sp. 27YEA15]|uniref:class I adenylate-forming enzyme family protein n=1 Tax=Rhodococcus sp. 27YEA15 TaxID=3156259 RepID=UPI003C7DBF74
MKNGTATRNALQAAADRPLLYYRDESFSGAEIDTAVDGLAARLRSLINHGGVVGIWSWNSPELLVAHLAAERAGLTRVPIDPEAPQAEAQAILDAVGADLVLVDDEHSLDGGRASHTLTPDVWTVQGSDFSPSERDGQHIAIRIVRGIDGGGLINIPLTQDNWDAHMRQSESFLRSDLYGHTVGPESTYLTVQQLQYGTGLLGTFPFIRMGLPQVILRKFDAAEVVAAVKRHRVTTTFMVPGMVKRLCDTLENYDMSSWTLNVLYGGAPFVLADMLRAAAVLGPHRLNQLYGRFEGGWPITVLDGADHQRIAAGEHGLASSCGCVVPGIEVDLAHRVADDPRAELRVRSDCTAPLFTDADGWCALGDLVTVDDEGHVFLLGRLDGMINTGAFHVYPAEVAAAITAEFPGAVAVEVEGRPDERWGEAVTAIMVWTDIDQAPNNDEFRQRMSARLAKYKVPTLIEHRDVP